LRVGVPVILISDETVIILLGGRVVRKVDIAVQFEGAFALIQRKLIGDTTCYTPGATAELWVSESALVLVNGSFPAESDMLTETDIPDVNSAVKRGICGRGVDEALFAGGMRTNERHQLADTETHVREAVGESLDWAVGIQNLKQPLGRDVLWLTAPDVGPDNWPTWTRELQRNDLSIVT
jgi:hypothetical protein